MRNRCEATWDSNNRCDKDAYHVGSHEHADVSTNTMIIWKLGEGVMRQTIHFPKPLPKARRTKQANQSAVALETGTAR